MKLTDAARKQAGEVLHGLKASQLTTFLEREGLDEAPDPKERLEKALTEVRGLKREEWKDQRDAIADEVAEVLAGADAEKADKASDRVVSLLSKVHAMIDKDFKGQNGRPRKGAWTRSSARRAGRGGEEPGGTRPGGTAVEPAAGRGAEARSK